MYIQLLFCPIRVKAQGLTFFPFVQFNISALGYLYLQWPFFVGGRRRGLGWLIIELKFGGAESFPFFSYRKGKVLKILLMRFKVKICNFIRIIQSACQVQFSINNTFKVLVSEQPVEKIQLREEYHFDTYCNLYKI